MRMRQSDSLDERIEPRIKEEVRGGEGAQPLATETEEPALFPIVYFERLQATRTVTPLSFEREVFRRGVCARLQLPLRLAWAITVHKSQGMSLSRVVCDLRECSQPGQ
eukprot:3806525-Pleurochrysis_carterae.AAC.1